MNLKIEDCRKYDGVFFHSIYSRLNPEEKNKIDKLKSSNDRELSLLALKMLENITSTPLEKIYHNRKRPVVDGFFVSITHKYPYVAVAVSDTPIGIDIETIRHIDSNVIAYLGGGDDISTLIEWTKRESKYKSALEKNYHYKTFIYDRQFILTICTKD